MQIMLQSLRLQSMHLVAFYSLLGFSRVLLKELKDHETYVKADILFKIIYIPFGVLYFLDSILKKNNLNESPILGNRVINTIKTYIKHFVYVALHSFLWGVQLFVLFVFLLPGFALLQGLLL